MTYRQLNERMSVRAKRKRGVIFEDQRIRVTWDEYTLDALSYTRPIDLKQRQEVY
jgi:hypothetical protein